MRTYFKREHKKVLDSQRSGASGDSIYQPVWPFYQALLFLNDTIELRPVVDNYHELSNQSDYHLSDIPSEMQPEMIPEESASCPELDASSFNVDDNTKKRRTDVLPIIASATDALKTLVSKQKSDEVDAFVTMLGHQLRSIENVPERRRAMHELSGFMLSLLNK
ncbi:Uncharacterised protein g585 [Pycnogonum litorale]